MDTLTRLLLLCLSGLVGGEPLGRLLQLRRDAFQVYAQRFAREYEPYMFAAIPLHAPVPVLRVLTRAPRPDAQAAPSALHAAYARPYRLYPQPAAAAAAHPAPRYEEPRYYPKPAPPARPYSSPEPDYEPSSYDYRQEYPAPARQPSPRRPVAPVLEYAAEYDSYAPQPQPSPTFALAPYESVAYSATQEAAPTVLYARPSPSGGFTYRRVNNEPLAPKKKAPLKEKDPPFIIKIHKYRIVKDDLF